MADAKLLAGGHSLIPLMKLRFAAPSLLVDLRRVPGLRGVERDNGALRIGAMTRHADLQERGELGLVARAAAAIADQQVRNRGTIGGSLAHGDPAADLGAVLLVADGHVTVQGPAGERTIAADELFRDYMTTALAADEVLTSVTLAGARRLRHRLSEVQPPQRGLGDGRRVRARQARRGLLVRGRSHRPDQHGVDAAARARRRGGAARAAAG